MSTTVKKIPVSESGPNVTHFNESGTEFKVTRNPKKDKFTLWKKNKDGWERLAIKSSPYELYPIMEKKG